MKRAKAKRSKTQKRAETRSRSASRSTTRKITARKPTSKRKTASRTAAKRQTKRSTRAKSSATRSRKKVTVRKSNKHTASKSPARKKTPTRQTVSRARRSSTSHSLVRAPKRRRKKPIPSPLPRRHIAPPPPPLLMPARSMPPLHGQASAADRLAMTFTDFAEAGVMLSISYSIRNGRRQEFFDLMKELKPLLAMIGGADCTIYEDRSRPSYFMEVFRFKDEPEFTAFDDKFHKDRKIAAVYSLLDDIVEAEKSDFKIFERKV